ncbi:MAG: carbohydrate-binding protein [Phycisphaerales bacterium]|jgi:hypothetical protein|nr:carbohydrate-binding protein [Phycisphaerales bacterium]
MPTHYAGRPTFRLSLAAGLAACAAGGAAPAAPIEIGFLWHMHQPVYAPYLTPQAADPLFSFSVPDVHNQRFGPYTAWPRDAVQKGAAMAHFGAQVSFSGSLIENLNALEAANVNGGMWNNWDGAYRASQSMLTSLGNPRLDLVAFGYHHPLMPLIDERSIRLQLKLHELATARTDGFHAPASRGLFPPETAFSTRMIPALAAEGLEWVLVDNIHFDRACQGYPHTNASGIFPPNRADQINPDPATSGGRWAQLNNLWAPSRVSVPFGYQPAYVQHVDPATGAISRIIAIPAARYEGNEDGRGGYGAFLYDQVMDAYLPDNTNPARPMFVVLHHDGDNFGGGSEGYYNSNFQSMVNWVSNDPDYEVSTISDYIDRFPVPQNAVIHVEDGSWAGADSGDPEFKKWLGGNVSAGATSPDINSWAVLVAARNRLAHLEQIQPVNINSTSDLNNILAGTGLPVHRAWRFLLCSQASDYWYWDGTEVWDSNTARGANQASTLMDPVLASSLTNDLTPPTIFVPQREPYNPGALEFNATPEPSDFEVWTLAYDYSGFQSVTLKWRTDLDGVNPLSSIQNETYAGGPEVTAWNSAAMTGASVPTPPGVLQATHKATRYGARIEGQQDVLIDYYVEATDAKGNVARSDIMHVWVGAGATSGGERVTLDPNPPVAGQNVTISYDSAGGPLAGAGSVRLHYGFDNWASVISPDPAMTFSGTTQRWTISVPVSPIAAQLDMVFNDGANTWDNNNGQDWHFAVQGGGPVDQWEIDGSLDTDATLVAQRAGVSLWAGLKGTTLYLATNPASGGNDRFIALAQTPGAMANAMWSKGGQVAQWDAFVGNEESNGWAGWFDQQGAAQVARNSVLEATLDLAGEFGALPEEIRVCVLSYATADTGALAAALQVPAGNANGNVEANEYLTLRLCDLTSEGCCPADWDASGGQPNSSDFLAYLNDWSAHAPRADLAPQGGDGAWDSSDFLAYLNVYAQGC